MNERLASAETTESRMYVDADGHLVEHPTGIQDYAPAELRAAVWHVETDAEGTEWVVMGGAREPRQRVRGIGGRRVLRRAEAAGVGR